MATDLCEGSFQQKCAEKKMTENDAPVKVSELIVKM